ncbi:MULTISPECIES: carbohydrate ABC transporter permease [Bosea]|jgi:multiple sugar transport system permease protein|uniref:Carbohydrate ABC transporter permease n=1 Tax=Bosea rubneri TaxID=3075434 RepID=A0ABU3S1E6_9HYPH|nr:MULTISPECIES: carbohydrate ABC transporter permease [unclassified Bosea (in: a-proteobacteria)]MDU0338277.1 carbohydrate ABC transporter permease [Bosea sp. ZW T0_25]HEV7338468.1 carbohydrate ABC transporter permease [Bosea sp. (in: a-proteobacteria)]
MPMVISGRLGQRGRERLLNTTAYALLILAILIVFFPLAWMLSVSFRPNIEVMQMPPDWLPQIFTLDGYKKIFTTPRYLVVFLNTMVISLVVTLLSLVLGAMAAYALARFNFAGQRAVLMFLITTQMFPLVLLCIPYFRIFITFGLYDTRTSLVIVYLTFTLPFCILMLRSYFINIPRDIEEAAMVDGCSRLGAIFRTLVPISYPAFVGAGLYTFLLAWNEFLFAVVLIESWENRVLTMAIYSLMAEFVTDWNAMMAFSVLASLPLVVAFIFLQRYMVQGMTAGALTS